MTTYRWVFEALEVELGTTVQDYQARIEALEAAVAVL